MCVCDHALHGTIVGNKETDMGQRAWNIIKKDQGDGSVGILGTVWLMWRHHDHGNACKIKYLTGSLLTVLEDERMRMSP